MKTLRNPKSMLIVLGVSLLAILFICLSTLPSMVWGFNALTFEGDDEPSSSYEDFLE